MIEGIGQTQVNTRVGMTFARGLRAILRQDPDVVMVGEIRDTETAEIAVQASLTGHLVLSTLHTNTAVGGDHAFAGYGRGAFPALFQSDGRDGAATGSHAVPPTAASPRLPLTKKNACWELPTRVPSLCTIRRAAPPVIIKVSADVLPSMS